VKKHIEAEHFELLCAYVDELIVGNISSSQRVNDENYKSSNQLKNGPM
jgi:hypothetical protein